MIPRIIHYVWVGPRALSDEAKRRIDGWRMIMPDYQIMEWNNNNINFNVNSLQAAFAVGAWNRVANYQRLCALIEHGGIYLDTDIEVRKRFDPLLHNLCFLGFQRDDALHDIVNNAVIGAEKDHWLTRTVQHCLNEQFHGAVEVGSASGPGLVSRILLDNGLGGYVDEPVKVRDITIYPKRYFYPYRWDESFSESCVTPDTFCIHLWEHAWWLKQLSICRKIEKRLDYWLALATSQLAFNRAMRRIRRRQRMRGPIN